MTPAEEMTRLSSQRMDRQDMEFMASLCGLSSCSYIDAASTIAVLLLAGTGFSTGCSDGEAATLAKLLRRDIGWRELITPLVSSYSSSHLAHLQLPITPSLLFLLTLSLLS
ncbi:hypothetical protein C8J57DRAFT_1513542 [Mycena rebaudengoi]|nr:hypothetical protein C8J57DRAFT_1513542 [Mycena rebaudengoi]